jgi:hypothetical protein
MKSKEQISFTVDSWVYVEELPVSANLKVLRKNNPDYGLTEDEIQDRNEFIRCHLLSDFGLLTMIPKQETEDDFFIFDCDVTSPEYSAFNTHDYQRTQRPFNKYAYAMKKIMERVKDLAIMHSSISQPENQQPVYERFKSFMALKFINEVEELARQLHIKNSHTEQSQIRRKIAKLSREISRCMKIWAQYAPAENWDR